MKDINRAVLQADINAAIEAANRHEDSMKDPARKANFFRWYLESKYPEIAGLLSHIAEIN